MRWTTFGFTQRIAVGIVLLSSAGPSALAQRAPAPSWPLTQPANLGGTPAERATMMAAVAEIERILRRVPELARPNGFEIMTNVGGGVSPLGDGWPLSYSFRLFFFAPSKEIAGHGADCIEVRVNAPHGNYDRFQMWDAAGRRFNVEDSIGEPKPGSTVVHLGLRWTSDTAGGRGAYINFTTGGKFPWVPVTREEYLRTQILYAEGKTGDQETSLRKRLEKTEYERWVENAAERKKNRDDAIAIALQVQGRVAADELRKIVEQDEREITERLKAADEEERKRNKEFLATETEGNRLRAEIAAMSPAERKSPAKVHAHGPLVPADDPEGQRILTPDPDFWRVRRSRAEVHLITVAFHPQGTCARPAVREALWKAYNTIDWLAFKRIVDAP
jgi:hypothetical protein